MDSLKRTPLYDQHVALGGKMVPFGGYELPVQYEAGIKKEHNAVRERVGLFDVSHMGELFIEGADALTALNRLLSNRFDSMKDGGCRYTVLCNDKGGAKDDLLVYRLNETRYLLVVNAANRDKDRDWIAEHLSGDVTLTDESDDWGLLAIQGPLAEQVLGRVADAEQLPKKFYTFVENVDVAGVSCLVSRTGYTGEDGFEVYVPKDGTVTVWDALLEAGKDDGIEPCGLGARDTLRLEAALPLYGHELTEDIDPLTAGLGFAVKLDKDDFIGLEALKAVGEPTLARVGLKMTGRGIAREGAVVQKDGKDVGSVTSGTHLPYLNGAYAMAYVPRDLAAVGTVLDVVIRNKPVACEVVPMPFYKRS